MAGGISLHEIINIHYHSQADVYVDTFYNNNNNI